MNKKHKITIIFVISLGLSGCGSFPLASGTVPLSAKTKEEIQLDTLTCKDRAKLEANTTERQAGAFALGLTIVGAPLAYQIERDKQREVFKSCMESKNYRVIPVDGEQPVKQSVSSNQSAEQAINNGNITEQLTQLKTLKEQNLISQEDYEKKKADLLNKL